jgi:hypothetical protein
MLYVVCSDGQVEEIADATAVSANGSLVCKDANGSIVREYDPLTVLMFGYDPKIKHYAALAREEERKALQL